MSPATLQKLRDPNYRIKQQNELGPDMPDTMMMGPYQRLRERERETSTSSVEARK